MATPHSTLCKCADMQSSCLWFHSCLTFVISYWSCHSSTHVTEYCTVASPHCTEWCNELPDPFTLLRNGVWPYDTNFDNAAPKKDKRQDHSSTNILDLTSPLDSLVPGPRPKNHNSLFWFFRWGLENKAILNFICFLLFQRKCDVLVVPMHFVSTWYHSCSSSFPQYSYSD